jgi:hypothetical protein
MRARAGVESRGVEAVAAAPRMREEAKRDDAGGG